MCTNGCSPNAEHQISRSAAMCNVIFEKMFSQRRLERPQCRFRLRQRNPATSVGRRSRRVGATQNASFTILSCTPFTCKLSRLHNHSLHCTFTIFPLDYRIQAATRENIHRTEYVQQIHGFHVFSLDNPPSSTSTHFRSFWVNIPCGFIGKEDIGPFVLEKSLTSKR
jgi:hypothetical protein